MDRKSRQVAICLFYHSEPSAYISTTKTDVVGTSRITKDVAGKYHQ